jgi:hypothetical protein
VAAGDTRNQHVSHPVRRALQGMKLENEITRRYLAQAISGPELLGACRASPVLAYDHYGRFLTRPALLEAAERIALDDDLARIYDLVRSLPARLFGGDLTRSRTPATGSWRAGRAPTPSGGRRSWPR